MHTLVLPAQDLQSIGFALRLLQQGELVAFPTDTVYGLGALVNSSPAIEKLFIAKGREAAKSIPVLLGDTGDLPRVAIDISPIATRLCQRFWPGALTVVVARHPDLPDNLGPEPTVGVRMPNHPTALALLRRSGPLAVTSANLSGGPNAVSANEVLAQLEGRIALILDGGLAPGGNPSTVVDCTCGNLLILRQGPLSEAELRAALNDPL